MNITSAARWVTTAGEFTEASAITSGLGFILARGQVEEVVEGRPKQLKPRDLRVFKGFASKLRHLTADLMRNGKAKFEPDAAESFSLKEMAGMLFAAVPVVAGGLATIAGTLGTILMGGLRILFSRVTTILVDATFMVLSRVIRIPYLFPALLVGGALAGGYLYWKYRKPGSLTVDFDRMWHDFMGEEKTPGTSTAPATYPKGQMLEVPHAGEVAIPAGASKGLQINNPGNIEYRGQTGAYKREGSRFAGFTSQAEGLYQIGRQLELYDSRGINTVRLIASKYAPAHENDTKSYIRDVSGWLGVDPDEKLPMDDPAFVARFIAAIVRRESGRAPYTDAQYAEAAVRAVNFRRRGYSDEATAANSTDPAPRSGTTTLTMPTTGTLTSPYGERVHPKDRVLRMHHGIDIAAPAGTDIYAATGGKIVRAGVNGGYGNFIELSDGTIITRYGHLKSIGVRTGDTVAQGQVIGKMGSTGISTGPHLHFEVQPVSASAPVDPATYLELGKLAVKGTSPGTAYTGTDFDYINKGGTIMRVKK